MTDKPFIHENFLLQSETAQHLFHDHAKKLPIIDYHCHLNPQEVASDHKFRSITELWLGGDHYKWRALRTNGVDEKYITGDASDWDKFKKWAETMPYCMRNPLYHWTHLELKTCFGIDKVLNPDTAKEIYDECNEKLASPEFSARNLMLHYNVEAVCTTDDPIDSLEYHKQVRESGFKVKVLPTWRPDMAMTVENPAVYREYIDKLAKVSGLSINCFDDIVKALLVRHKYFEEQGCRLSDHGMEEFYADDFTASELDTIFAKVYGGTALTDQEIHSMDKLTKTIIYNLNPSDFEMVGTTIGNFQDGSVPGKIQLGAGWWFLDQKNGMEQQMQVLSMLGLLSRFVGMLTDSRSFVSYARHEYFRRILCNLIGNDVEKGEIPASEMPRVEQMIEDIAYFNAKKYFNF